MPVTHKPNAEKYPVDICYLVADLKYNSQQGVKICEIQQASLSLFNGDTYRNDAEESIHKELLRVLNSYNKNGWVVAETIADKKLVSELAGAKWRNPKDLIALFSDEDFKRRSKLPPKDRYDLASYQGFLYASWSQFSVIYDFEQRLPGMVMVDKSSFPFWIDKYRMTRLFAEDEQLAAIKPRWGNYKKIYSKRLAEKITQELHCDTFVIKPRGNFMGKGVIITSGEDLDKILRYIITKKGKLARSKNSAYVAWQYDRFDSFIVEEFVASDPIRLPHVDNKLYQPTMRVAFVLAYTNHQHYVHFLGEYWKTPHLSIDEPGDFMEKNKDICEPPYYLAVDATTQQIVRGKLSTTLPKLHHKMLQFSPGPNEDFYAPVSHGGVRLVLQPATEGNTSTR
ncbi:MAG TPA: hypothetical protein VLG92_03705 [Candidatus Saccharimonadia bacterium]|nr:hypothetical protein [Candidatus Saccharimonadia bacterium]